VQNVITQVVRRMHRLVAVTATLAICVASFGALAAPAAAQSPPVSLIGWWRAEGNADDSVGAHHGTLRSGAAFATGKLGQAFSLDGIDDYVEVPDASGLDLTHYTASAWVYWRGAGDAWGTGGEWQTVLSKGPAFGAPHHNENYAFYIAQPGLNQPGLVHHVLDAGGTRLGFDTPAVVPLNQWVHLAATYDGSVARTYVNGHLKASFNVTAVPLTNTYPFRIGSRESTGTQGDVEGHFFLNGLVDEVRVYSQALSGAEISSLFDTTVPATTATYFSDPAATTVATATGITLRKDLSGFGNYGAADGRADILFGSGQAATWQFALPAGISPAAVEAATFRLSLVADDHTTDPQLYSYRVWTNGTHVFAGPANLSHGAPNGTLFTNWVQREYASSVGAAVYTVTVQNPSVSGGGSWIAVDWIELQLTLDTAPPSLTLPPNQTAEATSPSGAVVSYPAATASDAASGVAAGSPSCSPASGSTFTLGSTTVQCTATDNAGSQSSGAFTVTVRDTTPPTASVAGTTALNEGGTGSWTATVSDLVSGALTITWDLDGDDTFGDATGASASRGFAQNGTYTVRARGSDQAGNAAVASQSLIVSNVGPTVTGVASSVDPVAVNTAVGATASFTDPGTSDTHSAIFDWGDGSTIAGAVSEASGSGTATGSHSYATPGVYTVAATVADGDGGSGSGTFQYVVVYDPSGGFVTGGGWITSPAGAYAVDPGLSGKANFGFNAKYQNGANVPTGNTQFHFKAGSLNFHSTSYQWLVVAGAKAQFKGSGAINGTGDYGFILTAVDGQVSGGGGADKFRIKIWSNATGAVVYDSQIGADDTAEPSTVLGGGSIVIHK
jgi:hypothetical protein